MTGHADKVDRLFVWELKTTGSLKYVRSAPHDTHVAQANLYMFLSQKKYAKIVYLSKVNLSIVEHTIQFSDALAATTLASFANVSNCVQGKKLPNRIDAKCEHAQCAQCCFVKECKVNKNDF